MTGIWTNEVKKITYSDTYDSRMQAFFVKCAERLLVPSELKRRYFEMRSILNAGADIGEAALKAFGIQPIIQSGSMDNVPKKGPVMILANHPFGIVDGLALASLVRNHRKDLKVLAHRSVSQIPPLAEYFLPILFRNNEEARQVNKDSIQKLKDHLGDGGVAIVFPAGAVSTRLPFWRECQDIKWHPAAVKWAKEANADIIPFFIEGENSWFFHMASHFGMTMRLCTLLRENYKQFDKMIRIHIGQSIDISGMVSGPDLNPLAQMIRKQVYTLSTP